MALDLLFPHFDELICTPQDIQRLNEAILQLAVQGKLVPQDPNDEPASELLKRIEIHKLHLANQGKLKETNRLAAVQTHEMPFELPESWLWCRLGEVVDYGASNLSTSPQITDETWVLDLEDIEKTTSRLVQKVRAIERSFKSSKNVFQKHDVLYGKLRPYLDKVIVADEDGVCTTEIVPIRAFVGIDPFYLKLALKRPDFLAYVNSKTYGVKMPRLGTKDARMALFPLLPLAEQHRIVAKVDQLFAQTRALEASLRQAQADIVTANRAALHRLHTAQGDDQFQAAWRTLRDHFDVLYDDPRNVAELRQAILDLAVRGKLVAQDPEDEPASELLRKIGRAEGRDNGKKKSLRSTRGSGQSELPYVLPSLWGWAQFSEVANIATNSTDPGLFPDLPHVAPDNIEKLTGRLLAYRTVAEDGVSSVNHHFFAGQILYSKIRPNLSKAVLIDFEGLCSADMYPIQPLIDARYLHLYILSSTFLSSVTRNDTRVAMPKVNQEALSKVLVAVPPLAEQHRIVAKVDQLMRLCDALEAGLLHARAGRQRPVEAVLHGVTAS